MFLVYGEDPTGAPKTPANRPVGMRNSSIGRGPRVPICPQVLSPWDSLCQGSAHLTQAQGHPSYPPSAGCVPTRSQAQGSQSPLLGPGEELGVQVPRRGQGGVATRLSGKGPVGSLAWGTAAAGPGRAMWGCVPGGMRVWSLAVRQRRDPQQKLGGLGSGPCLGAPRGKEGVLGAKGQE